jgi:hypothetical protein
VLADWWFSLALSQNICQAKAGKSAAQTVFLGYSKNDRLIRKPAIERVKRQLGCNSCLSGESLLIQVGIKNVLD